MNPDLFPESPRARKFRLLLEHDLTQRDLQTGRTEGRHASLVAVMLARGFKLSAADRARVKGCRETAVLDRWIRRAATATSVTEVFGAANEGATPAAPARRAPARRTSRKR